ncbi:MAG: hypothetical protein C0419_02505 [Microbacterium sp.]|nr:hypothetical protein [Microbacterium sp.]
MRSWGSACKPPTSARASRRRARLPGDAGRALPRPARNTLLPRPAPPRPAPPRPAPPRPAPPRPASPRPASPSPAQPSPAQPSRAPSVRPAAAGAISRRYRSRCARMPHSRPARSPIEGRSRPKSLTFPSIGE